MLILGKLYRISVKSNVGFCPTFELNSTAVALYIEQNKTLLAVYLGKGKNNFEVGNYLFLTGKKIIVILQGSMTDKELKFEEII